MVVVADDHGPLDDIFQFPDIAGPVVTLDELQCQGCEHFLEAVLLIKCSHKKIQQRQNIVRTLPQGRNRDGKYHEA